MGHEVLLVEDDEDNAMMLSVYLRIEGHTVVVARDAESALNLAAASKPAVAIIDIGLPDVDGFTLARRLREAYTSLPLIAVTGHETFGARQRARRPASEPICSSRSISRSSTGCSPRSDPSVTRAGVAIAPRARM